MHIQTQILHVTIVQNLSSANAVYNADTEPTGDIGWGHPVQLYEGYL